MAEYFKTFTDTKVIDELIYDTLVVDSERTTDKVVEIKNDINYKGLVQQVSEGQLESGVIDNSIMEMTENIAKVHKTC